MRSENKIAIAATCISLISMFFSIHYSRKASITAATSINFQKIEIRLAYTTELRAWSERVIDLLSEASHVDFSDNNIKNSFLPRLSAEIEKGRLFFPNIKSDQYSAWKESAYQGFRPEILDSLVNVYDLVDKNIESYQSEIWQLRKVFVSDVQEELNPQEIENMLSTLNK